MSGVRLVHVEQIDSTQQHLQGLLDDALPREVVAVRADSQRAGRGRDGRTWQDPPGAAMLLSVGGRDLPVSVLDDLPRRVVDAVLGVLADPAAALKAPNDLVATHDGAKLGGVLVDARTQGELARIAVGIGVNVTGHPFVTGDGREATTLAALGIERDPDALAREVAAAVAELLSARR